MVALPPTIAEGTELDDIGWPAVTVQGITPV